MWECVFRPQTTGRWRMRNSFWMSWWRSCGGWVGNWATSNGGRNNESDVSEHDELVAKSLLEVHQLLPLCPPSGFLSDFLNRALNPYSKNKLLSKQAEVTLFICHLVGWVLHYWPPLSFRNHVPLTRSKNRCHRCLSVHHHHMNEQPPPTNDSGDYGKMPLVFTNNWPVCHWQNKWRPPKRAECRPGRHWRTWEVLDRWGSSEPELNREGEFRFFFFSLFLSIEWFHDNNKDLSNTPPISSRFLDFVESSTSVEDLNVMIDQFQAIDLMQKSSPAKKTQLQTSPDGRKLNEGRHLDGRIKGLDESWKEESERSES